jgi:hypothetical protein
MHFLRRWRLDAAVIVIFMRIPFFLSLASLLLSSLAVSGQMVNPTPLPLVPDLNARAITLVKPAFPETAVAVGVDGLAVSLRVIVDENGLVTSAKCSCPPMLKDAAEVAAAMSKFKPLIIDGKAVTFEGILSYAFVMQRVRWAQFGSFLESARQFDNISFGPISQLLTDEYAKERSQLLSLNGVDYEARQNGIREVEGSIRGKLKGLDLWRFEMAMALRRITFWTVAAERTDRPALRQAIEDLPKIISKAPDGVPAKLIEDLNAVAKYRVPADLGERELRQEITNLTRMIRLDP